MKLSKGESVNSQEPTKAELEILQILWTCGPSTVRFVNQEMNKVRELNYTSTLKQMQVMTEKGLLGRDETSLKHIYRPAQEEKKTKEHLLNRFIDALYLGSAKNLMLQVLGNTKTSAEDLKAIRDVMDHLEQKNEL